MKLVRYGVAIGLLAGLGACSNLMGDRGTTQSTAVVAPPAVAPDMVKQVQAKLRDAGYYKQGAVDGVWGSGTQAAVRSFQQDHNLTTNGQLDMATLQAMNLGSGTTVDTTTNNPPPPTQPNYNPPPPASQTAPAAPR